MKTPDMVLGRFLAKKDGEHYQDGDYYYDAMDIINALSWNGFKIIRRRKRSPARKEKP